MTYITYIHLASAAAFFLIYILFHHFLCIQHISTFSKIYYEGGVKINIFTIFFYLTTIR